MPSLSSLGTRSFPIHALRFIRAIRFIRGCFSFLPGYFCQLIHPQWPLQSRTVLPPTRPPRATGRPGTQEKDPPHLLFADVTLLPCGSENSQPAAGRRLHHLRVAAAVQADRGPVAAGVLHDSRLQVDSQRAHSLAPGDRQSRRRRVPPFGDLPWSISHGHAVELPQVRQSSVFRRRMHEIRPVACIQRLCTALRRSDENRNWRLNCPRRALHSCLESTQRESRCRRSRCGQNGKQSGR